MAGKILQIAKKKTKNRSEIRVLSLLYKDDDEQDDMGVDHSEGEIF